MLILKRLGDINKAFGALGAKDCQAHSSPYKYAYTAGVFPGFDALMCGVVAAFDFTLRHDNVEAFPFIQDFGASLWVYAAVPMVEAYRANTPIWPGVVMIIETLAQFYSGAAMLPIFWIILLALTRNTKPRAVSKGDAESILFGTVVGYAIPSVLYWFYPTISLNLIWQAFPIEVTLLAFIYRVFRRKTHYKAHGYGTIRTLYGLIFVASTLVHWHALSSFDFQFGKAWDVYRPMQSLPYEGKTHLIMNSILQWDYYLIFGGMALASLWLVAESILEGIAIICWFVVGSALFGTGGAISAIWLLREKKIQEKPNFKVA